MRRITLGVVALLAVFVATLEAPIAAREQRANARASAPAVAPPVNLNTATAAELESLPGIGVRTAELIIAYREKNGGFKKIEELMNVRGVGEKSFLRLKPLITVTPIKAK